MNIAKTYHVSNAVTFEIAYSSDSEEACRAEAEKLCISTSRKFLVLKIVAEYSVTQTLTVADRT